MKKRGRGVACMYYGIWGGASVATVKLDLGGTVTLVTCEVDVGQGSNTIFSQIVAEELCLPEDRVNVVSGDSDVMPHAGGTGASRVTYMGGAAVRKAAVEVKEKIFAAAAERLGAKIEELETSDGKIYLKAAHEKSVTFDEIRERWGPIIATSSFQPSHNFSRVLLSSSPVDPETGQGNPFSTYVYATQIADVEVDTETGVVKVLKIVAAHDVGKAINPDLVKGQICGGIGFGVGQAIMEDMKIVNGFSENPNLRDYLIPTSVDMPDVEVILVEENDPAGPFGAKGVGEPACLPTAPAIINAIYNAIGVRIRDLPATPEKVLAALKKNGIQSNQNSA